MKVLILLILAFVAYTYAANGVSSYQSTLGSRRSSISSGSGGLVQSSGVNQRQNVQQISTAPQLAARGPEVAQKKSGRVIIIPQSAPSPTVRPISSSLSKSSVQPVRTVQVVPQKISTPINLNQGQTQVNYGSNSGISKQPNVRPVSYSQPPVVTAQPVRNVQVVPQKISTSINQQQTSRQVNTGISNQQNVRPVSYAQPIVAAQPVRTVQVVPQKVSTPINLSGISNQQSVRPVSYSQQPVVTVKPVQTVQVVPQKVSTPVRPASYSQPIVTPQPVRNVQVVPQKISQPINLNQGQIQVNSGISKQQNVRPVSYSQPTNTVQPVRTVQAVPQKITTSINQQQTARQVNTGIRYTQPITTARPVSYSQKPVVTAQPVQKVQVVPQKISKPVRPASYSQPIVAAQPVRNVQVVSQKISTQNQGQTQVNYGSNSGISNQQNDRPIAYSQPTVRPVSNQQSVRPVSYSQPIVTAERARTIQVAPQKISAVPINQGLNVNQVSYSNNQQQLRPVSYSQPQVTVQPVQTVQVVPQQIVSSSPINLGGVSYGSGLGLNQGQAIQQVNYNQQTVRPISYSQQTITSQPIQTVQQVSQPIVYTQTLPIRSIKFAPQQIISQSFPQQYQISPQPINLYYGQPIRQVSLLQPQLASNLAGTNYAYTQPTYTNYGGNIGQDQYYILGKKK